MTLYIEKLKINITSKQTYWSITDFVLGDFGQAGFYFFDNLPITSIVKNIILKNLENNNIFLGKRFGSYGIDIADLLHNNYDNTIIEIPVCHLQFCNINEIVSLSEKYKIIFTDLEEGNSYKFSWFDPTTKTTLTGNIDKFLKKSGLNIDNAFFLNTGFDKIKFCREIKILNFWVVLTALCSPIIQDIIQNNSENKYLELLKNREYKKFAVFKNWRARKWRVVLLSLLYDKNLLPNIDWSLVGEHDYKTVPTTFDLKHFLKFANDAWLDNNVYKEKIDRFFKDNSSVLPKLLDNVSEINTDSIIKTYEKDIKRYKFSIDIETHTSMSEKIVKSFILGYMPIVAYTSKKSYYIKRIKQLGFHILDEQFDNVDNIDEIISRMLDKIDQLEKTNETPSYKLLKENFQKCSNKEILASYISQPLIDTFRNIT